MGARRGAVRGDKESRPRGDPSAGLDQAFVPAPVPTQITRIGTRSGPRCLARGVTTEGLQGFAPSWAGSAGPRRFKCAILAPMTETELPTSRADAEAELETLCAQRDRVRRVFFTVLAVGLALGLAWAAPPRSVGLWCLVGLLGFLAIGTGLGLISPPKPRAHPHQARITQLERYLASRP